MKRSRIIIYWISTCWLALGMLSTGIVQLIQLDAEVERNTHLGYPVYLLSLLGMWKLLGSIAVLLPRLPLLKEWAYAGFFFVMSGAIYSHIMQHDEAKELFGPALLLTLTVVSWYFRPNERKIVMPSLHHMNQQTAQ